MAEAILQTDGQGRFRAFSAGSQPKGVVNPYAIETLAASGYPVEGLSSKSWEAFAAPGAPVMDFIFTVCDSAAGEACPVWPGRPATAHWGLADPAAVAGTDIDKRRAFNETFRLLRQRISVFINLPVASLDRISLTAKLRDIGRMEGATKGPGNAD